MVHVRHGWSNVDGENEPESKKGERDVPVAGTLRLFLPAHCTGTGRRGRDLFFGRARTKPFTPSYIRKRAH